MKVIKVSFLFSVFSLLASCGGGGTDVVETPLPPPTTGVVVNYSGPPAGTEDIQNFKLNVWDNIATSDRCGACHVQGQQAPTFARNDDINLAYADINPLVNLSSPQDSALINKVASGHNCWLASPQACVDILTTWVSNWGSNEASATSITLQAPVLKDPGENKNFPPSADLFAQTVYPQLETYCAACHTSTAAIPIAPYFASADLDEAYEAAKPRLNLDIPADSRIVGRVRDEFHNCWSDCQDNAQSLIDSINDMAQQIDTTQLDSNLVNSKALTLFDGTLASGGGRFENNAIAKWEFKTGSGNVAFDTSGVEPALNLTLSGQYNWVGGYGIQLMQGKAQGATQSSKKLADLLTATGEFAIEMWVAPANVTQEMARIVSYSGGLDRRNFTVTQSLYNYDMALRSSASDLNGMPILSTADADEDLQAALQHVVINVDAINGRQIFVNGEFTDDVDPQPNATLTEWDDSFAFVLGNEVSNDRPWAGTLRMVAVHNRTLEPEQIVKNFDAGIGQKYFLLFAVGELIDSPNSYVVFEVSQFDSYSYLFTEPYFINLDGTPSLANLPIEGLRIGVNGKESPLGQAFANLSTNLDTNQYVEGQGQALSRLGALVLLEKGPEADEFFLVFDKLGDNTSVRVPALPPVQATPADLPEQADLGVRQFAEINATMAQMTRVPLSHSATQATFEALSQQLPSVTNLDSFLASNQMAVTQLAIKYCDALVEDSNLRDAYFTGFDFNQPATSAFSAEARAQIVTPLLNNMLGQNLASQPDNNLVNTELNNLISRLTDCSNGKVCDTGYTQTVVKASCAAVLGSASMLVQ